MLNTIVAGIDERPSSRDAAVLGELLASGTGADLVLAAAYVDPLLPFPLTVTRDVHREHDARNRLAAVRPLDAPSAHTVTVPDYSAARALRRTARDRRADLLVIGSGRDTPAGEAAAGRTGRQILHDAPCAVAIAAAGLHEGPRRLARIVVGVDATPEAQLALRLAEEVAGSSQATVTAISVADDRLPLDAFPLGMVGELADWDDIIAARRRKLSEHLDALLRDQPAVARDVRVGDPADELAAAAGDADLLVIGSRTWGTLDRIAIGSVAEALTARAPCSLLIVPRPGEAAHAHHNSRAAQTAVDPIQS